MTISVRVMFAPNKASQQLPNNNGTLEKSRTVGENLWIILESCGQKFIIYLGKIFIVLALL
jgi:hypothetical protein